MIAPSAGPGHVMLLLWGGWALSWFAAAMWSKRASARPGLGSEAAYRVVIAIGALIFFEPLWIHRMSFPLWGIGSEALLWALVGLEAAGFLFCWWARIHLGDLWSGAVTRKEGHRIVDTGPYRLVRHPIYTGIIVALLATAIARGTLAAVIGLAVMTLGFWMKARLEEGFLREGLGPEAYDAYRRRVPMLVPFWPMPH